MNEKIKEFRQEIAKLEKEQKSLKPQRKTENFTGERTVDHWTADSLVRSNKCELRAMYAAYGLMRGKKFNQIESAAKPLGEPWHDGIYVDIELRGKHPLYLYCGEINKYLEKYGYKLPYEEKENYWGQKVKAFDYEHIEEIVCSCEQTA